MITRLRECFIDTATGWKEGIKKEICLHARTPPTTRFVRRYQVERE